MAKESIEFIIINFNNEHKTKSCSKWTIITVFIRLTALDAY